jgi:tetratricopeptide (TPR) repeat protein
LCNSIGDPINWGNAQIVRFWHAHYRGQSALAETLATGLLSRARRTGNQQQATWALRALGLVRLRHGATAAARPKLESALASARPEDVNEFMPTQAALASCYHDLGNSERAQELLDAALNLARSTGRPTGHAVLPGLSAIAKVSLALASNDPAARPRVKLALERLDAYRRVFPIGLPAYLTWHAQALEQNGNFRAASRAKQRASEASERLRMLGELETEIG